MGDNDVKSTCGGFRYFVQIVARCIKVDSKSDTLWKFYFKRWQDEKTLFQNHVFAKTFSFKTMLFKNKFFYRIVLFKNIFFFKTMLFKKIFFFKIWPVVKILIQNLTHCIFFQSKIVRVVKLWNQNLTRCENFVSKSDALEIFNSKSDKFEDFFSESWFSSCFSGSDWMMIASVNVNTNFILKRRIKRECVL